VPIIETMEQSALDLARRVVDDGPSYPTIGTIFQFLREASEFGLVTVNFELATIDAREPILPPRKES
jgi:hypothetical protein